MNFEWPHFNHWRQAHIPCAALYLHIPSSSQCIPHSLHLLISPSLQHYRWREGLEMSSVTLFLERNRYLGQKVMNKLYALVIEISNSVSDAAGMDCAFFKDKLFFTCVFVLGSVHVCIYAFLSGVFFLFTYWIHFFLIIFTVVVSSLLLNFFLR